MTKPVNLGVPSRFALLGIEDDDEDEDGGIFSKPAQGKKPNPKKGPRKFVPLSTVGLTSEKAEKHKKSGKKHAKAAEFDDEMGSKVGDTDEMEKALQMSEATFEAEEKRRRDEEDWEHQITGKDVPVSQKNRGDVHQAKSDSEETAGHTDGHGENKDLEGGESDDEIEEMAKAATAEAKQIVAAAKGQGEMSHVDAFKRLYKLYKTKFDDAVKMLKENKDEMASVNTKLAKTKARLKLYSQLLADAEVREKAELAHSAQQAAKLNEELMNQLAEMHKELEQARSRIRELENDQKKVSPLRKLAFQLDSTTNDQKNDQIPSETIDDCNEASDSPRSDAPRPSNELILHCTDDGDICAVYEKRQTASTSNEEMGSLKRSAKRYLQRHVVSFDDHIVVVDGHSTFSFDQLPSRCESNRQLIRLKGLMRRLLTWFRITKSETASLTTCNSEFYVKDVADSLEPAPDQSPKDFHVSSMQSVDQLNVSPLYEYARSRFDLPAAPDRFRINPIFQADEERHVDTTSRGHLYCDVTPGMTPQWRPDIFYEKQMYWTDASSSYLPTVHSKADRRLRAENNDQNYLDFDQLRTKKFGLAIVTTVMILALTGIGIGLTIYFD